MSNAVRSYFARRLWPELPANFDSDGIRIVATAEFGVIACAGKFGCAAERRNSLQVYLVGDDTHVLDVRAHCVNCNPAMSVAVDLVCHWGRGRDFESVLASSHDRSALHGLISQIDDGNGADDVREKAEYVLLALRQAVRVHLCLEAEPAPAIEAPHRDD